MFTKTYATGKILATLFIFSLPLAQVMAQQAVIDSLLIVLEEMNTDTGKVNILLDISWEYHNSKPKETINYAQRALDLAESAGFGRGKASSLNMIGIGLEVQGELDDAKTYFEYALELAREQGNKKMQRGCLNNIGLVYERQGSFNLAMEYYNQALGMTDAKKDPGMSSILLNNIGLIQGSLKQYDKALEYLERSLAIERRRGDKLGIAMAMNNIGELYMDKKEFEKAEMYFHESIKLSEEIEDRMGLGIALCSLGEVKMEQGDLELAAKFFPQAYEIAREVGDKESLSHTLNCLGKVAGKQKNYFKAIRYCREGLTIAKDVGARDLVKDIYGTLSETYAGRGDYIRAYEYQKAFKELNDSLYSEDKSRRVIELSTLYDMNQKDAENRLLKEEQAKNESMLQRRTIISWSIVLVLLLVSIIAFILYSSNQQKHAYSRQLEQEVSTRTEELRESNEKLKRSNKELERFAYIASHDLKEPLRNIVSFTRLIDRRLPDNTSGEIREYLDYVIKSTHQMHLLVEDVLEFSRIENLEIKKTAVDLNEIVRSVSGILGNSLQERKVQLHIAHDLPVVAANASHLFLIFKNLIENGIKYNRNPQPHIQVSWKNAGEVNQFIVEDNGIGIDPEFHDRIFGMFKRLHNREEYQGSGLGLSICKKIISNYGGRIWVESAEEQGSRFIFTLPVVPVTVESDVIFEV